MNKDRAEGAAKQAEGSLHEAIGMITGDVSAQEHGAQKKRDGEAQSAAEDARDHATVDKQQD